MLTGLAATLILGACASTTTAPVSVASVGADAHNIAAGTYSVTVNGTTTNMGTSTAVTLGGEVWNNPAMIAYAFENADVLVAGGIGRTPNTPFAGVTGTPAASTFIAVYTGRIGVVGVNPATSALINQNLILSLGVDFAAGTVAQNSGDLTIAGTITGSVFTGTVGWSGLTAPMAGGFYGTHTAAGAFLGIIP